MILEFMYYFVCFNSVPSVKKKREEETWRNRVKERRGMLGKTKEKEEEGEMIEETEEVRSDKMRRNRKEKY